MNYFLLWHRDSRLDDESNSKCVTCLVEDESVRLDGMNSKIISFDFVDHDHKCQSFNLEDDSCDAS